MDLSREQRGKSADFSASERVRFRLRLASRKGIEPKSPTTIDFRVFRRALPWTNHNKIHQKSIRRRVRSSFGQKIASGGAEKARSNIRYCKRFIESIRRYFFSKTLWVRSPYGYLAVFSLACPCCAPFQNAEKAAYFLFTRFGAFLFLTLPPHCQKPASHPFAWRRLAPLACPFRRRKNGLLPFHTLRRVSFF